jgi:hypothetical protein
VYDVDDLIATPGAEITRALSASDESACRKLLKLAGTLATGSIAVTATTVGQAAGKYLQMITADRKITHVLVTELSHNNNSVCRWQDLLA